MQALRMNRSGSTSASKCTTRGSVALALCVGAFLGVTVAFTGVAQAAQLDGSHASRTSAVTGSGPRSQRVGEAPRVLGGKHFGSLTGSTRIRIDITLLPRDPAALAEFATAVSTPGNLDYRKFLARGQFANRFGPSPAAIAAVENQLRTEGLNPGAISSDHLIIPVTATASAFAEAFKIGFDTYEMKGGRVAYANTSPPFLGVATQYVEGVVGLDDLYHPQPLRVEHPSATGNPLVVARTSTTGGPEPCSTAVADAPTDDAYTANEIASMYNFGDLYGDGDLGTGITVAIYELEPNFASDITAFQSCYGTSATVSYIPVDGGPTGKPGGKEANGLETELDIENVIGLAPDATVDVYQAPNTDASEIDNYAAIVDDDTAQVVSTSWGLCESEAGSAVISEEGTLFEQAATQGQSVFAAAGDDGSTDCGDSGLSVDDPGTQPFVTSVGGTTTTSDTAPPTQTVWNESAKRGGAGGGGASSSHVMPSYQSSAPSSLNVINSKSSATPCDAPTGSYCREVPDVSANADPYTAYLIYYEGTWGGVAGTSGAAPLWAAFTALSDASSYCGGALIGFANPVLYDAAANNYSSDFFDVTSGSNDYTPDGYKGGLYPAGTGYDMASGLGTPNGANLPVAYCTHSVYVTYPGNQTGAVGIPLSLQMQGTDSSGQTLTWSATGLPAGLSVAPTTGLITGAPTVAGTVSVTVTAQDSTGASGSASFTWNVAADTTKTTLKLSSATITHGQEQVETISVTVTGGGVGVASGTVTVKAGAKSLCTVTLSHGIASCKLTASKLATGAYSVVALYAGNANFDASTSPPRKLKVAS